MDIDTRKLLFLGLCIPARLVLSILPKMKVFLGKYLKSYTDIAYKLFGIVILCMSLGFLYLFFLNKRLDAGESGGKTWWHNLRLIHGINYLCAAIYIFVDKTEYASIPLGIDVLFGLFAHLNHHNFNIV